MKQKIETLCVQAGYTPKTGESRIPPIVQSTTFFYGDSQAMADLFDLKREGFFYSRLANPTVDALEKRSPRWKAAYAASAVHPACLPSF